MKSKSLLASWRLGAGFLFFSFLLLVHISCTGSGAVNPITPKNSTQPDSASSADSEVIYWTSFPVTFTLTDPLNGVFLISKKLGWACGNNGTVLKFDGDTWAKVDTGLAKSENLLAVAFASENEGWMVGSHGTILHYNNDNWSLDDSQTQESLYSVAVTRSRTVWVVGSNGTMLTYNGVSWGKIPLQTTGASPTTITEDLYSVGLSDQNNGWAVGNRGTILRYDGQKWLPYAGASPSTERLNSVSAINNVQAWIVGAFGTILSFNGTTWNKQGSASSGSDLYQISMRDDNNGWAVGQDGTLIYYDGSRWISHQKPLAKPSLNALSFYKDLGFAVGTNGSILKYLPNGELTKVSFMFKGEVTKKPAKSIPYWTITYTLMNQNPKTSPFMNFEMPLPKGFESYQIKDTPTPTPGPASSAGPVSVTPTPTLPPQTPSAVLGQPTPSGSPVPVRSASAVSGAWKVKDNNVVWEVGTFAATEMKTLTITLQEKKNEKKEYPVLLKALLKSDDRVMAEAAPVTMMASEKPVVLSQRVPGARRTVVPSNLTPTPLPTAVNPTPTIGSTPSVGSPKAIPGKAITPVAVEDDSDSDEGDTPNAKTTPTSGN